MIGPITHNRAHESTALKFPQLYQVMFEPFELLPLGMISTIDSEENTIHTTIGCVKP